MLSSPGEPGRMPTVDVRTIGLIQDSFEKIRALQIESADIFYAELFAIDPALRSLFSDDMQDQKRKFLHALNYMIYALRMPGKILQSMEKLGRTRVHCGVAPEHYVSFGNALLRMLKKTLGPEFTPDLSKAWQEAFLAFADTMNATAADSTTVTMLE